MKFEKSKVQKILKKICKKNKKNNIAVIRLSGVIGKVSALSSGLSYEGLEYLDNINKIKNLKAIVVLVNSPGGSPVQSELMAKKIRDIAVIKNKKGKKGKKEKRLPIYSFCEDVAASGGYWLALSGDEIYASRSSVIGSIGVISAGFGFTGLIEKLGIERRVYSQGKNKSVLDPFQEAKKDDIKLINELQKDVHEAFIDYVKSRRGKKIKAKDDEIFNGKFWGGDQAVKLGLIDGIAYYPELMREKFGEDIEFKTIAPKQGFLKRKLNSRMKIQIESFLRLGKEYVDELAIWNRYGL